MSVQIQVRRSTTSEWSTNNPVLAQGEPGFDYTLKKLKIGDGTTAWNSLPYTNIAGLLHGTQAALIPDVMAQGYPGDFATDNTKMKFTGITIPFDFNIDGLFITFDAATIGNYVAGIYGPFTDPTTLGTLPLVASQASTAVPTTSGSGATTVKLPITGTGLAAGNYMLAVQFATSSKNFIKCANPGQPFQDLYAWQFTHTYGSVPSSVIFDNSSNATKGGNCPAMWASVTPA